jgi:hypothetical protein
MGGNGGGVGEGIHTNRHTPRWGRFVGEIYAFGGIWNSDSVAWPAGSLFGAASPSCFFLVLEKQVRTPLFPSS